MRERAKNPARFYVYLLLRADGMTPFYVGKGQRDRWSGHEREGRAINPHKAAVIAKIHALGMKVPRLKVASGLTEQQAFAVESALISAYGRHPAGPLVNLTDGGEGVAGLKRSPEALAKFVAATRGQKRSPETRARISAGLRAASANSPRRLSDEHKAKIGAACRGKVLNLSEEERLRRRRSAPRAVNLGKKFSDETRRKMSEAAKGRTLSAESRKKISESRKRRLVSP